MKSRNAHYPKNGKSRHAKRSMLFIRPLVIVGRLLKKVPVNKENHGPRRPSVARKNTAPTRKKLRA
jgi:hypothetical protein